MDESQEQTKSAEGSPQTSPHDIREQMVARGDFRGLFESITNSSSAHIDLEEVFAQLMRAIDVASRRDLAAFSDDIFQAMLSFSTNLMLRLQYACAQAVARNDRSLSSRPHSLVPLVDNELLERYVQIEDHVAHLAAASASTSRLWNLSRQKQLEIKVKERRLRRRAARHKKADGSGNGNGHRVDGPLGHRQTTLLPGELC